MEGRVPAAMRHGLTSFFAVLVCGVLASCGGGDDPDLPADADRDSVPDTLDCAPGDSSKWRNLSYASVDQDGDGRGVNSGGQICSGAALPASYSTSTVAASDVDCDDSQKAYYRFLAYVSTDLDGDQHNVATSGNICSGENLRAGYSTTVPTQLSTDCDDSRASVWQWMTTFKDPDGDGVGSGAGAPVCSGNSAATGFSWLGYDPLDDPSDPDSILVSNIDLLPALRAVR